MQLEETIADHKMDSDDFDRTAETSALLVSRSKHVQQSSKL